MKRLLASFLLSASPALSQVDLEFLVEGDDGTLEVSATQGDLVMVFVHVAIDLNVGSQDTHGVVLAAYPFLAPPDHTQGNWQLTTLRSLVQVDSGVAGSADLYVPAGRIWDFVDAANTAAEKDPFGVVASGGPDVFDGSETDPTTIKTDERYPWHRPGAWRLDANGNPTSEFDINLVAREAVLMSAYDYYYPLEPNDDQLTGLFDLLHGETGFDVTFQAVVIQDEDNDPDPRPRLKISMPRSIKRVSLGPNGNQAWQYLGGVTTIPNLFRPNGWDSVLVPGAPLLIEFDEDIQQDWIVTAFIPVEGGGQVAVPALPQVVFPGTQQVIMPNGLQFVPPMEGSSGGPQATPGFIQFVVEGPGLPAQFLAPKHPYGQGSFAESVSVLMIFL